MYTLLLVTFVFGYACIALEHTIEFDKAAIAILTAVVCWTVLMIGQQTIFPGGPEEGFCFFRWWP